MKFVRNNVFETNSSSAHSLAFGTSKIIRGNDYSTGEDETDFSNPLYRLIDVPTCYHGIELDLCLGEYCWGYDELCTPQEKLSYLLTSLGDTLKEVKNHPFYQQIVEWLSESGVTTYDIENDEGYIDHQSYGMIDSSLFKTKEDLITYLFNDNIIIYIENDNSDYQEWYTGERSED